MKPHLNATARQFFNDFTFVCCAAFGIGTGIGAFAAGVLLLVNAAA
jgi:hypothetical protein